MSDIELVIKIPKEMYKWVNDANKFFDDYGISDFIDLVKHGTPLPKGHGRILDEKDILGIENNDGGWYDLVDMPEYIAGIKAIIEADTESEDKE